MGSERVLALSWLEESLEEWKWLFRGVGLECMIVAHLMKFEYIPHEPVSPSLTFLFRSLYPPSKVLVVLLKKLFL
jgi:hypothetical protein